MSDSRKRQRDEGQNDAWEGTIRIAPVYTGFTSGESAFGKGSTLSLPCSLGRRNLAELWWKNCPKRCHAERPEARPCMRFCSPVRRKSHLSLLSREILTIDASGAVNLLTKNSGIVRWSHEHCDAHLRSLKRLHSGENYMLMIGNFLEQPEKPWMIFKIGMHSIVSPDRSHDIQVEDREKLPTRRRLFHSEDNISYNQDALVVFGETEKSHHGQFTQIQDSCDTNNAKSIPIQLHQSSSISINQSDSSTGDKLDTQQGGLPGNAKRSLISPQIRVNAPQSPAQKNDSFNLYHAEKHADPPLQPRQLFVPDQAEIGPSTSSRTRNRAMSSVGHSFRETVESEESALCLPRGETQNTNDCESRVTSYPESPLVNESNSLSVVQLQITGKCRDWPLDDWVTLSHQNLASAFGKRLVDLVVSKNRGANQLHVQLPPIIDVSTIGMPFNMNEKKPVLRKKQLACK